MRKFIEFLLFSFFKLILSVRYRVTVKGAEILNKETLNKPGGVLFAPNHPAAFVDPALVTLAVWKKYPIRPLIVEYMYYLPVVHALMKFLNAIPVPDFDISSNTMKRRRTEQVIQKVIERVKEKENFLIYPAGQCKQTGVEVIGGSSGVHQIMQSAPEANLVLVRMKGMWGSSFSRALLGRTPPLIPTILSGIKIALKNLIFFTPKREITIEFSLPPDDFPMEASRLDFNHYLERWYNKPDGLTKQEGDLPGDSLILVSYSFWKEDYPEVYQPPKEDKGLTKITKVSEEVQKKVTEKLVQLTEIPAEKISMDMNLSTDLGLDSLDIAELSAFLQDQFDIEGVPVKDLTTVSRLMGIASGQVRVKAVVEESSADFSKWRRKGERHRVQAADGATMPEVFLNNCDRYSKEMAIGDMRAGMLTYGSCKMRAILLAEYIRNLPGEYVGIMLPSSVATYITILATQLAGKVPLMINWTVGRRHLEQVREVSGVQTILSSWAFIDRLENVDLSPIEDIMVQLEDVRRDFSIFRKIQAVVRSKKKTGSILKAFGIENLSKDTPGVLLFTSGTEAAPKGVPLTHDNVLSNMRAAFEAIDLYSDDVIFGILPPFHSFGFTVSGLMALMSGMRLALSPDPTDGKTLAHGFEKWKITIMCGAPTFLKGLLKASSPEQLKTMRYCVTGAEKAPPELFQMMAQIGKEQCLIEGYGITECSPILTANRPGKPRKGVGAPLPGVELIIIDPESKDVLPQGSRGLILARGPNVFGGYINPGLASPFMEVDGKQWYNTGDLGFLDEENRLTISGRLKRFLKMGPEMVSLPAVEEALLHAAPEKGWPLAEEGPTLAVCGKEDSGAKPKITVFALFDVSVDEINAALREAGFSNLVKVSDVVKIEEIPIMGTGKIHYRKLEEQYLASEKVE